METDTNVKRCSALKNSTTIWIFIKLHFKREKFVEKFPRCGLIANLFEAKRGMSRISGFVHVAKRENMQRVFLDKSISDYRYFQILRLWRLLVGGNVFSVYEHIFFKQIKFYSIREHSIFSEATVFPGRLNFFMYKNCKHFPKYSEINK